MKLAIPSLFMALLTVIGFVCGMSAMARFHAFDFSKGWTDGYAAGMGSARDHENEMAAAGLCTYASLACVERRARK